MALKMILNSDRFHRYFLLFLLVITLPFFMLLQVPAILTGTLCLIVKGMAYLCELGKLERLSLSLYFHAFILFNWADLWASKIIDWEGKLIRDLYLFSVGRLSYRKK